MASVEHMHISTQTTFIVVVLETWRLTGVVKLVLPRLRVLLSTSLCIFLVYWPSGQSPSVHLTYGEADKQKQQSETKAGLFGIGNHRNVRRPQTWLLVPHTVCFFGATKKHQAGIMGC
jgi:hypothetical protein